MTDRPPYDDAVPFDPAPRPGEVAAIVSRARRRKALRLAVPVSSIALAVLAGSLLSAPTPRSDQRLQIADDPLTPATETAVPAASTPGRSPADHAAAPTPSGVTLPPPVGASPSPTRAPAPTRSASPGERRPYRGELGPRVEEYGYPACRQSHLEPGSRTRVHAGFCIQPTYRAPSGSGGTDLAPALRVCWQSESLQHGFLEFATQEEADFVLYEADIDDSGRTIPGRTLYRFSDTVTYTARAHQRRVLQGDCLVWTGRLDFDRARYGGGDFLLRLETATTTFAPAYRTFDIPFSA